MGSSHMSLFVMFVLVVPAFSRIHPSPIDDAIQPRISQGPVKQTPVQGQFTKDDSRFPSLAFLGRTPEKLLSRPLRT
ncbi:hypothetical protein DdX_14344 [Ditylenchus destructor]|uniref:Uncharacterized protein n=1 Tax=Ditylenchus destructor TaxID=166010 RepID=A0AAD4R215_9BILA|nr:hypothetical protein DdX_14344 [Ditylenchus destructor]